MLIRFIQLCTKLICNILAKVSKVIAAENVRSLLQNTMKKKTSIALWFFVGIIKRKLFKMLRSLFECSAINEIFN